MATGTKVRVADSWLHLLSCWWRQGWLQLLFPWPCCWRGRVRATVIVIIIACLQLRERWAPHLQRYSECYWLPASVVFEVEKAAAVYAHRRLTVDDDVNAKRIQLQMNHVMTKTKTYLIWRLLYQS